MGSSLQYLNDPRRVGRAALFVVCIATLTACSPTFRNYGYVPPQEDLEQVVVGIDTRASVEDTLGTTGSSSVVQDNAMYFVRSRVRTIALLAPEVVEREVVAVSFDASGVVQNVETFGLERGQVVQLTRRVTDSSVADKTFLRQLLGNIGQFTPGGISNGL
ncbi:MAG: outer membrane protein assembly factor BamE [Roseobacter sp.]